MLEHEPSPLEGKPVTYNGREVGWVTSVEDGYDGLYVHAIIKDTRLKDIIGSKHSEFIDVELKL